uniref:Reverse transcriptase domain-containing protein n=2 Tax=Trichogramma kaykai TaxID=54128 RepID=A0ABD2WFN1_9HYME
MERGEVTLLMLFDFSKAFDTVSHAVLMRRMCDLRFQPSTIEWFHSYLAGRRQAVLCTDGSTSRWEPSATGVPQGSSTGPILFLIYINSLLQALSHSRNSYMMYADDLQIYRHCARGDLPALVRSMNEDAATIKDWADRNGLMLNKAKTKAVLFTSSQQRRFFNDADVPPLIINNTIIPLVDKVCNLGVTMSKDLSWASHVRGMCSRAHGVLHCLRYRAGMLSCHVRRELAMTLVLPLMDYCCLVYLELLEYLATMLQ